MTDRKQALADLRDRVKAGGDPEFQCWVDAFFRSAFNAIEAYNGSLDAAKALHEAVLPGWRYTITNGPSGDVVVVADTLDKPVDTFGISRNNPARAWLLAILDVLIAQEEQEQT